MQYLKGIFINNVMKRWKWQFSQKISAYIFCFLLKHVNVFITCTKLFEWSKCFNQPTVWAKNMYQNSDYQIGICCSCTNFKVDLNKCTHTHTKSVTFNTKKFHFFPLFDYKWNNRWMSGERTKWKLCWRYSTNKKIKSSIWIPIYKTSIFSHLRHVSRLLQQLCSKELSLYLKRQLKLVV